MSQSIEEYKGEKVLTDLTARLMPPNDNYPDCMCEILLTKQHLYVLEDNFDGTYAEHFVFPIGQILKLEEKTFGKTTAKRTGITAFLLALLSLGGAIVSAGRKNMGSDSLLTITYTDGMGGAKGLCFHELESRASVMESVFKQLKEEQ